MVVAVTWGGLKMKLPALLRVYKNYIYSAGIARFEQSEQTVYVASANRFLLRQRKAMELLRHLDVAPQPTRVQRLRNLWIMPVRHRPLSELMPVWQSQTREGRIELIRRLGATIGMVHSLRNSGTGDITCPQPRAVSHYIVGKIRRNYLMLFLRGELGLFPGSLPVLSAEANNMWCSGGGTLTGGWKEFPPIKRWDNGLMIMDLSRASYSEPLQDLVNLRSQAIGLDDIYFFWEYFLQGYCATAELPLDWKERIELLYRIRLLQALANGRGQGEALGDWQSKWWEII